MAFGDRSLPLSAAAGVCWFPNTGIRFSFCAGCPATPLLVPIPDIELHLVAGEDILDELALSFRKISAFALFGHLGVHGQLLVIHMFGTQTVVIAHLLLKIPFQRGPHFFSQWQVAGLVAGQQERRGTADPGRAGCHGWRSSHRENSTPAHSCRNVPGHCVPNPFYRRPAG